MQPLGGCLLNMGLFEVARADYSRGLELLREALRVAHEADDETIIYFALFRLANMASRSGPAAGAARLWRLGSYKEAFGSLLSMGISFARHPQNKEGR
jgi:hypothetical protein